MNGDKVSYTCPNTDTKPLYNNYCDLTPWQWHDFFVNILICKSYTISIRISSLLGVHIYKYILFPSTCFGVVLFRLDNLFQDFTHWYSYIILLIITNILLKKNVIDTCFISEKTKYINTYRNQLHKFKYMVLLTVIKIEEEMLS